MVWTWNTLTFQARSTLRSGVDETVCSICFATSARKAKIAKRTAYRPQNQRCSASDGVNSRCQAKPEENSSNGPCRLDRKRGLVKPRSLPGGKAAGQACPLLSATTGRAQMPQRVWALLVPSTCTLIAVAKWGAEAAGSEPCLRNRLVRKPHLGGRPVRGRPRNGAIDTRASSDSSPRGPFMAIIAMRKESWHAQRECHGTKEPAPT